jgi:GWxTD domain-containing protein
MLRLAGENRGRRSPPGHDDPLKPLYWIGLEGGVNFSLLSSTRGLTHKDSLRAGLRHILSSQELSEFDATTEESIDTWYERYWQQKDLTPRTPLNEAREEFESRVQFANSKFGRLKRMGVETDRGRIVVVYGRPNYIETGEASSEISTYELWVYENRVRGYQGALFLFESGYTGEYRQIYSNVVGEITGALPATTPNRIFKTIDRYDPQR